ITLTTGDLDPGAGTLIFNGIKNVSATGNSFDTLTGTSAADLAYIESLIVHKPDSEVLLGQVDLLGLADYTSLGNLAVELTLDGDQVNEINEGQTITLTGSFTNEPKAHTVTIVW